MSTTSISQNVVYGLKVCSTCGQEKDVSLYYKENKQCKECRKKISTIYQQNHKKEANERSRKWKIRNPEKARDVMKAWKEKNPEKAKANWKNRDMEKRKISSRLWRENNRDKILLYDIKRRSTPQGRIDDSMSSGIRQALRREKGNCHWPELVGYTVNDLKRHLEKQFKVGMTWDNYGKVWHIDHRIPKVAFNYEKPGDFDFIRCWALKNLRPLWSFDNVSKHCKVDVPFQPSLAMGGIGCRQVVYKQI